MTLDKLHEIAERALKVGLADLGFDMSGNVSFSEQCSRKNETN